MFVLFVVLNGILYAIVHNETVIIKSLSAFLFIVLLNSSIVFGEDTDASDIPDCSDRTHTVSSNATGGGDGSVGAPWTLAEAMESAVAGDTVCILSGTYIGTEPDTSTDYLLFTPAFRPSNSGTAQSPIWFVAEYPASSNSSNLSEIYSGASVSESGWPAIGVLSRDYVKFSGIYLNESASQGKSAKDSAPFVARSCTGCELHNYKIFGENHTSDNHSGIRIEYAPGFKESNGYISGFQGYTNCAGIIIYKSSNVDFGNGVIENVEHGVQIKGGETITTFSIYDVRIHHKIIRNATHGFRFHGPVKGPDGELNLIYNNIVYDVSFIAEFTSSEKHDGEQDGLRIFNNTFYNVAGKDPGALTLVFTYEESGGTIPRDNQFFNNIIHTTESYWGRYGEGYDEHGIANFMESDRNVFYAIDQFMNGSYGQPLDSVSLATWQALGQDTNSIDLDPLFADVDLGDFTLQGNSPALLLGRDRLNRFGNGFNSVISAGAFVAENEIIGLRPESKSEPIWDIDKDGMVSLPDAIHVLQVLSGM